MPTSFPGAIDNFTNPSGGTYQNDAALTHSTLHANAFDAIEAIENLLGINGGNFAGINDTRFTRIPRNTLGSAITAYTLVLTDVAKVVEGTAATAITITIPANSTVAFPFNPDSYIEIFQYGAGQITVAGAAGVAIRSPGNKYKTASQYSSIGLRKRDTNEWVLSGELVA